jgi:hypothetical protein
MVEYSMATADCLAESIATGKNHDNFAVTVTPGLIISRANFFAAGEESTGTMNEQ